MRSTSLLLLLVAVSEFVAGAPVPVQRWAPRNVDGKTSHVERDVGVDNGDATVHLARRVLEQTDVLRKAERVVEGVDEHVGSTSTGSGERRESLARAANHRPANLDGGGETALHLTSADATHEQRDFRPLQPTYKKWRQIIGGGLLGVVLGIPTGVSLTLIRLKKHERHYRGLPSGPHVPVEPPFMPKGSGTTPDKPQLRKREHTDIGLAKRDFKSDVIGKLGNLKDLLSVRRGSSTATTTAGTEGKVTTELAEGTGREASKQPGRGRRLAKNVVIGAGVGTATSWAAFESYNNKVLKNRLQQEQEQRKGLQDRLNNAGGSGTGVGTGQGWTTLPPSSPFTPVKMLHAPGYGSTTLPERGPGSPILKRSISIESDVGPEKMQKLVKRSSKNATNSDDHTNGADSKQDKDGKEHEEKKEQDDAFNPGHKPLHIYGGPNKFLDTNGKRKDALIIGPIGLPALKNDGKGNQQDDDEKKEHEEKKEQDDAFNPGHKHLHIYGGPKKFLDKNRHLRKELVMDSPAPPALMKRSSSGFPWILTGAIATGTLLYLKDLPWTIRKSTPKVNAPNTSVDMTQRLKSMGYKVGEDGRLSAIN